MRKPWLSVSVECYAGFQAEQEVTAIYFAGRRIVAAEVLDRWLAPEHRYCKFRGTDRGIYIVRYDLVADRWELVAFQAGSPLRA